VVSFTPWLFDPREIDCNTLWIGGWVEPRVGLDAIEKRKNLPLPGTEPRPSNPLITVTLKKNRTLLNQYEDKKCIFQDEHANDLHDEKDTPTLLY
jgi:hypothetical protein